MSKLEIIAATQFDKAAWQVKQPIPKIELVEIQGQMLPRQRGHVLDTQIDKILLVGENVEIFYRMRTDPGHGLHTTLCKPTVSIITSIGNEAIWREAMEDLDDRESVEEVTDTLEKVWRLNEDVPDQPMFTIVRMAMLGDSVEIFAQPKTGTPFDQNGYFFHFQLLPFFVQQMTAKSDLNNWMALQTEYIALVQELEEEEDEDEEEEDENAFDPDEPLETSPGFPGTGFPIAPPPPPGAIGQSILTPAQPIQPVQPNGTSTQINSGSE